MKGYIYFLITFNLIYAQNSTSLKAIELWRGILQTPYIIKYFNGVISKVGVKIKETEERFTLYHNGSKIFFEPNIDEDALYSIEIKMENVMNMVSHASDGVFSSFESWRIINVLFTPMFQSTFIITMNDPFRKRLAKLEDITHVYLYSYDGKTLIPKHTIINDQNGLVVKKGIVGQANRVYKLTADQGLDFQKRMQRTLTINSAFEWIKFGKWYLKWRDTYSTALS